LAWLVGRAVGQVGDRPLGLVHDLPGEDRRLVGVGLQQRDHDLLDQRRALDRVGDRVAASAELDLTLLLGPKHPVEVEQHRHEVHAARLGDRHRGLEVGEHELAEPARGPGVVEGHAGAAIREHEPADHLQPAVGHLLELGRRTRRAWCARRNSPQALAPKSPPY
jgi:hypothetical protein